jgi:ribonuclease HI
MAKQKYYVVWSGRAPGIYTTWDACREQVHGFNGARYKSFSTESEAKQAYSTGASASPKRKLGERKKTTQSTLSSKKMDYIEESICVDAACSGNPGDMEYQGVHTKTGEQMFHFGPVPNGTNNIGEFLAIVHALALLKKTNNDMPIYSDSLIAINWVRKKQCNTTIPRNRSTEKLWEVIDRALKWLQTNTYPNELLKWETKIWGEVKADFGRK